MNEEDIMLYVLLFVICIALILLITRQLTWNCIKEDKLEKAEKLHKFNKEMHTVLSKGTRITKDFSVASMTLSKTTNPIMGVLNILFWIGVNSALENYDHSKIIRDEVKKEVEELLQFIDLLSKKTTHQVVKDFLNDLKQDVLNKRDVFECVEEIQDIVDTLKFISDIRNDVVEASELSEEDIANVAQEDRRNYYEIFGVSQNASFDEIKKVYRGLAQKYHPDKNPSDTTGEMFKQINTIYKVLKDPEKRREYDNSLA